MRVGPSSIDYSECFFLPFVCLVCHAVSPSVRVRFAENTVLEPVPIHLEALSDGTSEAHIGLLRIHHSYTADIPISHGLGPEVIAQHPQHNVCVKVLEVSETEPLLVMTDKADSSSGATGTGNTHRNIVKVEVTTNKEGSLGEMIDLMSSQDNSKAMKVFVTAQVLKGTHGNPLLKKGVHMLSHHHMDESDATEWPGYARELNDEEKAEQ